MPPYHCVLNKIILILFYWIKLIFKYVYFCLKSNFYTKIAYWITTQSLLHTFTYVCMNAHYSVALSHPRSRYPTLAEKRSPKNITTMALHSDLLIYSFADFSCSGVLIKTQNTLSTFFIRSYALSLFAAFMRRVV